jgi:hypothetical protein
MSADLRRLKTASGWIAAAAIALVVVIVMVANANPSVLVPMPISVPISVTAAADERMAEKQEKEYMAGEARKKKLEAVQSLMDESLDKAQAFMEEKKFKEALHVLSLLLDEAEKHGFTEEHRELEQRRHHLKYKWEKYTKDQEARVRKFRRRLEVGKVYDLLESADRFKAEWYVRNDNVKLSKDKELEFRCDSISTPASMTANYSGKEKWLDYEVEFEYKSSAGFIIHYRYKRGVRPGSARVAPAPDWKKIRFVISGVTAQIFVNDALMAESVVELNPGYLAITHAGTGVGFVRNLKIKVAALEGG